MLDRAEGTPIKILPVPMQLTKVGLYAVDPLPSIPFGINQARALEMSNVTDHNEVDAFGLDESDLLSLGVSERGNSPLETGVHVGATMRRLSNPSNQIAGGLAVVSPTRSLRSAVRSLAERNSGIPL